jgi:cytochrome c-type biogenesis protein CcmH/NrfG
VKFAREAANAAEVTDQKVGDAVLSYRDAGQLRPSGRG